MWRMATGLDTAELDYNIDCFPSLLAALNNILACELPRKAMSHLSKSFEAFFFFLPRATTIKLHVYVFFVITYPRPLPYPSLRFQK